MCIRRMKEDELDMLIDLYAHLVPDDVKARREDLEKTWKDIFSHSDRYAYFAAYEGNVPVAGCNVSIVPNLTRGSRPFAVIENVVTHPDHRRKGFGKKVMEAAVEFAREKNCYKVMLLSNVKRKEAHQFYAQIGFNGDEKKGYVMSL